MSYIRTQPSANDIAPKLDIKSKFYESQRLSQDNRGKAGTVLSSYDFSSNPKH